MPTILTKRKLRSIILEINCYGLSAAHRKHKKIVMESLENLTILEQELLPPSNPSNSGANSVNGGVARHMPALRREVAAQALKELWGELQLAGEPLIFASPMQGRMQAEHHPMLLDSLATREKQRKKPLFGQLQS